jgi:heme exporter protein B
MSTMAVNTRFAELLLPVLMLPFLVPPITSAVQATARLFGGRPFAEIVGWLKLLLLFDIVFVVLCILLFEFAVEE